MTTDTSATDTTVTGARAYQDLPVATLNANPRNVRTDLAIDAAFRESIAANGVRQPLLVSAELVVTDGHRRLAAAIAAGLETVPCLIENTGDRKPWTDYLDMFTASHHHRHLTRQEEADALFGAHAEGATKTTLRKATGLKRDVVNAALTAGGLATTTREITENTDYTWTLDELAALAEFEDDPADVERLADAAGTRRWAYVVERIRNERTDRAEHTRLRAELEEAGYAVTDHLPATAIHIDDLEHDGQRLTAELHANCDGRGVYWVAYDAARFIHYCDDPDRCGHTRPPAGQDSPESAEPSGPDRKLVVEGNKAWVAAGTVRHGFLTQLLTRKTPPPEVARFVADALLAMPTPLTKWLGTAQQTPLLTELIGREDTATWRKAATDKRLPLVMLATIAAAYEYGLTGVTDHKSVWRTDRHSACPRADAATWLRFLASVGHALSPIEQAVVDGTDYTGDTTPQGRPVVEILTDADDTPCANSGPDAGDAPTDAAPGTTR